ncbi:protease modulator HflC [Desulfohalobiaceae bacterium Ax17]|jgi:membrane protease subunit HflC|uniref:protease modulator HflC n=1 Tax=Desulfovulcanus ferrireducens TaxID=2831190 RepID=UPI00207BC825|nr:protease modulator HflC [Desulfovulcanus ferrireducens]MBT8764215.1 protease modulator HflC [Desulfovulcanus ferrireducens]
MPYKKSSVLAIIFIILLLVGSQCVFTVDQTQRAIVLQLGKPVGSDLGPGLHFKLPFVQNVIYFDRRVLEYDAPPAEVLTKDKKNLVVDNYSRWRIKDPLTFYRSVRTISSGLSRLDDIIYAELRVALGQYSLTEVVSSKRSEIMSQVTKKCNKLLQEYGIEILDVRIKRTDLPPENQRAIYGRMRAERERQAKQYRSEGREEAVKIRTTADKERTIMIAEAVRKAEVLRGQGDAIATAIYARALAKDPNFYQFLRTMEAYKKGVNDNTSFVFTPDSEFWRFLNKSR